MMACAICDRLGERQEADHDEGQSLPKEVSQLQTIDEDPHTFDVLQCPACKTFYTYEYKCDNDIYNSIHVSIVERVTEESARRLMKMGAENDRKARQSLLQRVRKKYGASHQRLTQNEIRVIDHLVRRSMAGGGNHPKAMEASLQMTRSELEEILQRLEARHIIVRTVSTSGPDDDPRDYTHVKVNPAV